MNAQQTRFEAELAARVTELFRRCPALHGFILDEESPLPAHVICFPAVDDEQVERILGEVSGMLYEVVDEEPELAELLHGRTFARTLH
jgi:hypothetical protein